MLPAPPTGAPDLLPVAVRYAGDAGAGAQAGEHRVAARNRWSRVVLAFRGLRGEAWCSLHARIAFDPDEAASRVLDAALAGFDFRAADGSSLDVDHVPGLARTLLDPHGAWIAGPDFQSSGGAFTGTALVRIAFRVPAPARDLAVTVRSWRNTRAFSLAGAVLRPGADDAPSSLRRRRPLGPVPDTLRYGLVPGADLVLRGQLYAERPDEHAARVDIAYRDAAGAVLAPPYPGTVSVPPLGALVNLPARPQARRFTLTLRPPPGAVSVDLGFRTWEEAGAPAVELLAAPEVALDEPLRLESLCGDDLLDGPSFLARLAGRLGLPEDAPAGWIPAPAEAAAAPLALARARALRTGPERPAAGRPDGAVSLRLAGAPDWTLPEAPGWAEDPFRSAAWRLDYQSLSWLLPLAAEAPARAVALALAWSRANPWGRPADPLSLHPSALPARAEVWVGLLARPEARGAAPVLVGEAARHGFALAEIVGQNTLARTLHQVQAAAALLALARALPRLPPCALWASLARRSLRESIEALLGPDGAFAEPAPHRRLELLGLGRALGEALAGEEPGPLIAARAAAALPGVAGLLDPGGRLPAFGDSPHGVDHAGWIARLLRREARPPAEQALAAGRAPAPAPPAPACADVLVARHEALRRGWSHFACTYAEQSPQGHADCTSFAFATGSLRWIVEAGGSEQVETGAIRHYLLSARAHNVAVPDGREPAAGRGRLRGSLALGGATAHAIETGVHGPDYRHVRIFVLPDDLAGLAVIDRFTGPGGAISFEGLLHLAPDCLVALSGPRRAQAQQAGRRLSLVPFALAGQPAGLEVVFGRDDRPGALQGFVSRRPGELQPAGVLRYAVGGHGTACGGVLIAADGTAEDFLVRLLAREELARFVGEG
ncbi:hypothetical protein OPKNFCMD_5601 [Methylobacterium crusticola]|uniref:Heparinase II/III-like C-terminal domain-containing protein n=1 Tax=Methylobacterium crusticola TaxID=1697972 RepID=A0ABQ4R7Q4_9HYPH|nr:heparinase II/III family protein [Methylobacterium crusticola]GJD52834.1 hypothetical protein OPKNFCMD_5601 [Methylobacterium crusticola]